MFKILRTVLLCAFASATVLAASQDKVVRSQHRCLWSMAAAPTPVVPAPAHNDAPASYGGSAALAVGGLTIVSRLRRR